MPSVMSGALVFGLVSVPISVVSATEDHSVRFRRIHTVDNGLVRNKFWCEVEDREVSFGEIGNGHELPGGRVIPISDEELRALPLPTALESPQITDHYTNALRAVIKAKQEARPLPKAPEPAARPGELVDLMATLKQSVDKARAARGETREGDRRATPAR